MVSPRRAAFGSCQRLLRISLSQVGCDTRPRRHFSTDVTFVPLGDRHEWSVEGAAALGVSSLGRTTPDGIFTTCWFHSVVSVTAELLCMETVHPAAYVHRLACAHSHACSHAHSVTCTLSHMHALTHAPSHTPSHTVTHATSHTHPHRFARTVTHAQSRPQPPTHCRFPSAETSRHRNGSTLPPPRLGGHVIIAVAWSRAGSVVT